MRERLLDWWSAEMERRGPFEVLGDIWLLSLLVALFIGIALGAAFHR